MSDKELELQELETVKSQLELLGVKYHHNAKLETLATLLKEELAKKEETNPTPAADLKRSVREQVLKPVLVNITCLNPHKKTWRGEFFAFGNSVVGKCRDFVPYNCEDGKNIWIPQMLVNVLKERRFLHTTSLTERERGSSSAAHRLDWLPEFSVEILAQ